MHVKVRSFRAEKGKVPAKWKLTGLLLGIITALLALIVAYVALGDYPDDAGVTGGVAGVSAAILLGQTLGRLSRHAFKTYFGLVFFNTLTAALMVRHLGLTPHGTLEFMAAFTAVYLPLAAVDYSIIKIMEKRYGRGRD
jgi:hypothetical protein